MYREILKTFSLSDLKENVARFENTISELSYCLEDLEEKRDELRSTNEMLKSTVETFNSMQTLKPTACDHERSLSETLSTQYTEACETPMDDTEEAVNIKINKSAPQKSKINDVPLSTLHGKRVSKLASHEKTLHKTSVSMQQIPIAKEEDKQPRISIDLVEEVALPKHYLKAKTMTESRCTPYFRKAPRHPRKSTKDPEKA
ncbi:unnamed protein product [Blepharisma stoltei]|uniref:Shugoshin C-terminal domain-containing protein n=1 Tax=Blepharisma stoltei TaxID=1481888 RepID=A0AAU9JNM2_9CILI|nr:unnamed protein product [Blepharisma stoltei]